MAKAVWVRQLVGTSRHCPGACGVIEEQVAHTEWRQLLASLVAKDRIVDICVIYGCVAGDVRINSPTVRGDRSTPTPT